MSDTFVGFVRMLVLVSLLVLAWRCAHAEDLTARLEALQAAPAAPIVRVIPDLDRPRYFASTILPNDSAADLERQRRFAAEDAREEAAQARAEAADDFGKLTIGPGSELSRFDTYGVRRRHRR